MNSNEIRIDLSEQQTYIESSYRRFDKNEHHISRTAGYDVLLLVFDGILRFSEDGVPVEVASGEYYVQRRGLAQEGCLPSDSPAYYYIHFHACFTTPGNNADGAGLSLCGKYNYDALKLLFDELYTCEVQGSRNAVEKTRLFYGILSAIAKTAQNRLQSTVVERTTEYLAAHFREKITISDVCSSISYSGDYIIRAFRKAYGTTPHRYLTSLRLAEAKRLLVSTDRTVARIAGDCGYDDASVFYRAFRAAFGLSPEEWKKRH